MFDKLSSLYKKQSFLASIEILNARQMSAERPYAQHMSFHFECKLIQIIYKFFVLWNFPTNLRTISMLLYRSYFKWYLRETVNLFWLLLELSSLAWPNTHWLSWWL